MKNSYKAALLAVLGLTVATAAQAQINDGDLVIGFATSSADYVYDLGQVPSANTVLASSLATGLSLSSGVSVGVVGGDVDGGTIDPNGGEGVYTTTLRTGTAATSYTTAGTESAPTGHQPQSAIDSMASVAEQVTLGSTGVANGTSTTWSQLIAKSSTAAGSANLNFGSYVNPMTTAGTSETLDLWSANDDSGLNSFTYVGDLSITETSAGVATVTFDPAAVSVPEPTTYGLLAGFGLLAVGLRKQLSRKNA